MRKTHFTAALVMAALSGSLFAQTLVTVNGQAIDSSVIDGQVAALRAENKQIQDSPQLRQELTNRQVISTVIAQEAKRRKLDQSAEFKKALEQARADAKKQGADKKPSFKTEWAAFEDDLLGQALAIDVLRKNPVNEQEIKKSYDEFAKFYQGSQEVRLGEIVTRTKADGQKAAADLKAKKAFTAVLKQYSIDEEAKKAGGIPQAYVPLKDLQEAAPPLYAAVKDLKKGEATSEPLQDGNSYAVFYVDDRRDVKVPAFNEIKGNIARDLNTTRIDDTMRALLQKADIKSAK